MPAKPHPDALRVVVGAARGVARGQSAGGDVVASLCSLVTAGRAHLVADAARRHAVAGPVTELLLRVDETLPGLGPLIDLRAAQRAAHLRSLADVRLVATALRASPGGVGHDVPAAFLKGPALAALAYPRPDLRVGVDVDVLVAPADLGTAIGRLEAAGYTLLDRNWPLLEALRVRELRLASPTGGLLDLHWSLTPGGRGQELTPPADELLARAVTCDVGGRLVGVLEPADLALHVAVHACWSGADRVGWFLDFVLAADRVPGFSASERLRRWRCVPAVSLLSHRSRRVLRVAAAMPLPATLGSWWGRAAASTDRGRPVEAREPDAASASRLLARSARAGAVTSSVEAGRRAAAWAVHQRTPEAGGGPATSSHSGGSDGRRRFCETVAAGRW